jgi:hypothetical protein
LMARHGERINVGGRTYFRAHPAGGIGVQIVGRDNNKIQRFIRGGHFLKSTRKLNQLIAKER